MLNYPIHPLHRSALPGFDVTVKTQWLQACCQKSPDRKESFNSTIPSHLLLCHLSERPLNMSVCCLLSHHVSQTLITFRCPVSHVFSACDFMKVHGRCHALSILLGGVDSTWRLHGLVH